MKNWIFALLMVVMISFIFWSCSNDHSSTAPSNSVPVINSLTVSDTSVVQGGTVTLTCNATDEDGDSLTYSWTATRGVLSSTTGISTIWTAPDTVGTYTITVMVSDGEDSVLNSKIITVTETPNTPPVISSLTASDTTVELDSTVMLICNAEDSDGDSLVYLWTSTGGSLSSTTGTSTLWTAPNTGGSYTVIVTVSDGEDNDVDSLDIIVYECDNNGFVFINGGTFEMGDNFDEGNWYETPLHNVTVSDFYLGEAEVTQSQWEVYMPPGSYYSGSGDTYPVYYASWFETIKYCNLRSMAEGLTPCYTINSSTDPEVWGDVPYYDFDTQTHIGNTQLWDSVECNWPANGYRLPTEAEWEYAARGGIHNEDDYRYSGCHEELDLTNYAWYSSNSGSTCHPVKEKFSNQINLYDMSGNLHEWCWDWYGSSYYSSSPSDNPTGPSSGTYRIVRGGNRVSQAFNCRVAFRYYSHRDGSYLLIGFRISRTP